MHPEDGARRVELQVLGGAVNCYLACGFRQEGAAKRSYTQMAGSAERRCFVVEIVDVFGWNAAGCLGGPR
jgi:hypothetical protein